MVECSAIKVTVPDDQHANARLLMALLYAIGVMFLVAPENAFGPISVSAHRRASHRNRVPNHEFFCPTQLKVDHRRAVPPRVKTDALAANRPRGISTATDTIK